MFRHANVAVILAVTSLLAACSDEPYANARVVTARAELVGGQRALGEVGDFLLENDKIRVVIQGPSFSRGFGVFGGSLLDADLRRPSESGNSGGGTGFDAVAEVFPALLLQAVKVDSVSVVNDGSDGGPARVVASGSGGDLLEIVGALNRIVLGSHAVFSDPDSRPLIRYETEYSLAPGSEHLEMTFRVTNESGRNILLPSESTGDLLRVVGIEAEGFPVPTGDVLLFGDTSKVFMPGVGFDVRFGLEEAYERDVEFPALPGLTTEWMASRGPGVSYGFVVAPSERNYVFTHPADYSDAGAPVTQSTLLIPFVASSFLGAFHDQAPEELPAGDSFEVKKYFIVGRGDVGSVLDEIHRIREVPVGRLGGLALDSATGVPATDASVLVYRRNGDERRILAQYDVHEGGAFGGTLEPGDYTLRITGEGRPMGAPVDFHIAAGETTSLRTRVPSAGRLVVHLIDERGFRSPGKVTVVGTYGPEHAGELTRSFLFDLEAGEEYRSSDLVPDDPIDAATRRYIEAVGFADDGEVELALRPGRYKVVSSRGPEFDITRSDVEVLAGETASLTHAIHHVVPTPGWIATDLHIHSINSIDSSMPLDERVRSLAAEGLEWAVSTDHNFVTHFEPAIARNNLTDFVRTSVGMELTTLESGHFNGYPIDYQPGPVTHGAFEWAGRPPAELFDTLRSLGRYGPEETIVQVNHPRDSLLGYFAQYHRSTVDMSEIESASVIDNFIRPSGPAFVDGGETTFSFNFNALEVLNGKLTWQVRNFRVPESAPPDPDLPEVGAVLTTEEGQAAFPGVVDDWFNLLNQGRRIVAVGTSDSHGADNEVGYFRTMVQVGEDRPQAVEELEFVHGLKSQRAVATNGPMVDFFVDDPTEGAIGGTVTDPDGEVSLTVRLRAAPWISVGRINVIRNGAIAHTLMVDEDRDLTADPFEETFTLPLAEDGSGTRIDSWFAIEVIGYRSYFPVVRPLELPPILLSDAVESLAEPLGFGATVGGLAPQKVLPYRAYAITNPVWVTTEADRDFAPPGVLPADVQASPANDPGFALPEELQSGTFAQERSLKVPFAPGPLQLGRFLAAFGHGH